MTSPALDRELRSEASDPIGLDGIEFIEYTTPRPQALGQVLEMMGFRPIARHRSREVTLYRQGEMNIVVNASTPAPVDSEGELDEAPRIAAIALRVRDAAAAYRHVLDLGAWAVVGAENGRSFTCDRSMMDVQRRLGGNSGSHAARVAGLC